MRWLSWTGFPKDERKEEPETDLQDLWLWPGGAGTYGKTRGPRVGEGELSTTHFVIWHHKFNGGHRLHRWTITSIDTDQYIHVLLAMACGRIQPENAGKTEVTIRRRRGNGACDFLYVNRVYGAIADHDSWRSGLTDGGTEPSWLTREAKVVPFVVVYALAGCDFLASVYNMPFKKMLDLHDGVRLPGWFVRRGTHREG